MTRLTKSLLALSAVALTVGGTLWLRPKDAPAAPRLTPAQVAELKQQPEPPRVSPRPRVSEEMAPPPPPEDDAEDGSGS